CGELDVHGERGRITAQALGAHAEEVDGFAQGRLEGGSLRIRAGATEWTSGRLFREGHAKIRSPPDAYAHDRRWAGLPARFDHAVHDESLDGVHALGGDRHLEP